MADVLSISLDGLLTEDKRNVKNVICTRCPSKILTPGSAKFEEVDFELHAMKKKNASDSDFSKDKINQYYMVDDMFTFENIGFSNQVDNVKYLICADCEIGPVGWHDVNSKKSYIALPRIKHE